MRLRCRPCLRLIDHWNPLVCADLHVTDGADFEPDVSIQVEARQPGRSGSSCERAAVAGPTHRQAGCAGLDALDFYPDLAKTDDPSSGFALTVYSPRFLDRIFPTAQPVYCARRNALLERVCIARANHAQHCSKSRLVWSRRTAPSAEVVWPGRCKCNQIGRGRGDTGLRDSMARAFEGRGCFQRARGHRGCARHRVSRLRIYTNQVLRFRAGWSLSTIRRLLRSGACPCGMRLSLCW